MPRLTPNGKMLPPRDRLRSRVHEIKVLTGAKTSACYEELARAYGYRNWGAMSRAYVGN